MGSVVTVWPVGQVQLACEAEPVVLVAVHSVPVVVLAVDSVVVWVLVVGLVRHRKPHMEPATAAVWETVLAQAV